MKHPIDLPSLNLESSVLKPKRQTIFILILISAISLVGIANRFFFYYQTEHPIGDETAQYSLTKNRGLLPVWRNDMKFDDVTPFPGHYLFLYPFIKNYDIHNFVIRTPPLTMQILVFILLFFACRPFYKTWLGFAVAYTIVALNTTLTIHAFELRPYSVLPTLALISFYYADLIIRQDVRLLITQKILCTFLYVFICAFYAYGIFIAILPILYQWIANQCWKPEVRRSFDCNFLGKLVLISFCVWGWYAGGMIWKYIQRDSAMVLSGYNTFAYIPNPATDCIAFIKSVFGNLMGRKELYILLIGFGFIPFLERKERLQMIAFFIVLVVLPVGLSCLLSVTAHYAFLQRHFSWAIPFFAVFIGWLWDNFLIHRLSKQNRFS